MHRVLPNFRPPELLKTINAFLRPHPTKPAVLRMLANGLHGNWDTQFPQPNLPARNYLGSPTARQNSANALKMSSSLAELVVLAGPAIVHWFFDGDFYITPCGAVPKGKAPRADCA